MHLLINASHIQDAKKHHIYHLHPRFTVIVKDFAYTSITLSLAETLNCLKMLRCIFCRKIKAHPY